MWPWVSWWSHSAGVCRHLSSMLASSVLFLTLEHWSSKRSPGSAPHSVSDDKLKELSNCSAMTDFTLIYQFDWMIHCKLRCEWIVSSQKHYSWQTAVRLRSPWGKLKPITKLWQQWTALKQGPMLYAEQLYCYIFVSFLWGFIQAIVFINHKCDSRLDTYEHLHKCAVNDVFFHTTNPSLTSGYGCKVILLSP